MRAGEKVYDKSLKREVTITEDLLVAIRSMDPKVVSTRWGELLTVEEVIEEACEDGVMTLEEAREAYEVKEGKEVPNNKKNDLKWILSKIN